MTPLPQHSVLRGIAAITTQNPDTGTVNGHYGQVPKASL